MMRHIKQAADQFIAVLVAIAVFCAGRIPAAAQGLPLIRCAESEGLLAS